MNIIQRIDVPIEGQCLRLIMRGALYQALPKLPRGLTLWLGKFLKQFEKANMWSWTT